MLKAVKEKELQEEESVPFLRNFRWGGGGAKQEKGRTKNISCRGLANARV